jgi:hypothetical protein
VISGTGLAAPTFLGRLSSGCQRYCSDECANRAGTLRSRYGVDVNDFAARARAQNMRCAICGDEPPSPLHGGLCLDHCHTSLGVRGLLCRQCNSGLGMFRDRPDLMLRAIAYLEAA